MTDSTTTTGTTLTEKLDEQRKAEAPESQPSQVPVEALALPPPPGEDPLSLSLSLSEIGCIAASLQTAVHSGWIKQPTHVNIVNSVLRKIHDAKVQYVKDHP